jgi:RnfABCDGE-type electron transport complex D subunit
MFDVIIALLPATAFGVYHFGLQALLLILVTITACVVTEYLYELGMKREITVGDGSAILTGLLLALNLPPQLPYWMAVVGGVFAILVVKQLFGGLGQNFMNPALGARCFMLISFASAMTNFTYGDFDGVTSATPLAALKAGGDVKLLDMFLGNTAGTIGETSTVAILVGAVYLLYKRIIDFRIPFFYLVTFAICVTLFHGEADLVYLAAQLCGGGLMLGAFFMATDYVTSPITGKGRIIFGICLGLLTAIFRVYGGSAEGVSYAIIFCNLLVPIIDRISIPKAFGREKKHA